MSTFLKASINRFFGVSVIVWCRPLFTEHGAEWGTPATHPLQKVRELVQEVLKELDHGIGKMRSLLP
jgi:hypothetical protein